MYCRYIIVKCVSCSWISSQHETTEANLITNISSTQPSVANVNHQETITARDGPITFGEAAIQVDTDLFVCPSLKATKRTDEWEGVSDDNAAIKKGSKRKSTSHSTNN